MNKKTKIIISALLIAALITAGGVYINRKLNYIPQEVTELNKRMEQSAPETV